MNNTHQQLVDAVNGLYQLTVLRSLREDQILQSLIQARESAAAQNAAAYAAVGLLLEHRMECHVPAVSDPWTDYLLDLLLFLDNPITRALARESCLEAAAKMALLHDVQVLQHLAQAGEQILPHGFGLSDPSGMKYTAEGSTVAPAFSGWRRDVAQLKQKIAAASDWTDELDLLPRFWQRHGVGVLGQFPAFRWLPGRHYTEADQLGGVAVPDPIRLHQLIGYEEQKNLVVDNTRRLMEGIPAQNLLLYGDRGTGKSSLVKALVNEFADAGLRLVEVSKAGMASLFRLTDRLRRYPNPCIVFIDDLSFEETEVQYKELKGLLEGNVESQPDNVRIYVTTNRRHLVKERLSDMPEPGVSDEVRAKDTVEEKLSLADRFGMTVVFPTPDQAKYLTIVDGLAREAGIDLPPEELHARAMRWTMWHNARSGRTARQFIDQLRGEKPEL